MKSKSFQIGGLELIVTGRFPKIAKLKSEFDVPVETAEALARDLRQRAPGADLFTFMQRLPQSHPIYPYPMEWDNVAAIPITTYETWLFKQLHPNSRNKLRKAEKAGVVVRQLEINDELFKAIKEIQDECPIRQGARFRHYGESLETIKRGNSTFSERATVFGAYYKDEIIGFLKVVPTAGFARVMGILAKIRHHERAPMNALIAEAVKMCAEKQIPFLVYAKYAYGNSGSRTLMEFKANNGFEHILLPRYFVPLNSAGEMAQRLGLHRAIDQFVPQAAVNYLRDAKTRFVEWRYRTAIPQVVRPQPESVAAAAITPEK